MWHRPKVRTALMNQRAEEVSTACGCETYETWLMHNIGCYLQAWERRSSTLPVSSFRVAGPPWIEIN